MHYDARTLAEVFQRGAKVSNNGPCLGYRKQMPDGTSPYVWMSYNEVLNRSENFARGLIEKGIKPGQSSLIGVYSRNRPEVEKSFTLLTFKIISYTFLIKVSHC